MDLACLHRIRPLYEELAADLLGLGSFEMANSRITMLERVYSSFEGLSGLRGGRNCPNEKLTSLYVGSFYADFSGEEQRAERGRGAME